MNASTLKAGRSEPFTLGGVYYLLATLLIYLFIMSCHVLSCPGAGVCEET